MNLQSFFKSSFIESLVSEERLENSGPLAATGTNWESIQLVIVQFETVKFFGKPQIVLCTPKWFSLRCNTRAHGRHVRPKDCAFTLSCRSRRLAEIASILFWAGGWLDRSALTVWQWNSKAWQKSLRKHGFHQFAVWEPQNVSMRDGLTARLCHVKGPCKWNHSTALGMSTRWTSGWRWFQLLVGPGEVCMSSLSLRWLEVEF